MQTLLTKTVFTLSPGEVTSHSVHMAQRLHVEDAAGIDLWITREGDSEDYWLRGGASLSLRRGDEVILSIDPHAGRAVRLALIAEAQRPATALADAAHLPHRAGRRWIRGTAWTSGQEQVAN